MIYKIIYKAAQGAVRVKSADGKIALSTHFDVTRGLIQGDIISPIFFLLSLDELVKEYGLWFDCDRGRENRRLFSWYGYHGDNMSWRQLMTLVILVHFPEEEDMWLPTREEREDRTRGTVLTNLEKCFITKMFFTTGYSFPKLADLWGCCEKTVRKAVTYWQPRWHEASLHYSRFLVWDGYLKACQPAEWDGRYKLPISHMTDGSVKHTTKIMLELWESHYRLQQDVDSSVCPFTVVSSVSKPTCLCIEIGLTSSQAGLRDLLTKDLPEPVGTIATTTWLMCRLSFEPTPKT